MTTALRRAARPGTAITRALRELGLINRRPYRDFSITGVYSRGERDCTLAVIYNRHAQAIVLEHADIVERRCRELGWSVRVRTYTCTFESKKHGQGVITTIVEVSN